MARSPPRKPADRGPARRARWIALLAVALALAGGAWWLASGDGAPPSREFLAVSPPQPRREPTPAEVTDPLEQRRLADLEEARGRYASLRSGFGSGEPAEPAAVTRLSPALSALWPPGTVAWSVACTGRLCRVDGPAPARAWQDRLAGDPRVLAMAERVVVDPDGQATPAYLVLLPAGARPGATVLDSVEEDFRTSTEIRECLSRVGATGSVEYTVTLDTSGYSYRQSASLDAAALDCADRVLGEILDRHPPVQPVQTATRTLSLRR